MIRKIILIGVRKTGMLEALQAVDAGMEAMRAWAISQKIPPDNVISITDAADKPVTAQQIKDAVLTVVNRGDCDQLIVYFSGHGVNIRYGEYWLLSGAPENTQEAVNVDGSVVLARRCGIPHVVLISDACRTPAAGLEAQYVTGSEIFPNQGGNGPEQPVDLFFACGLGKPALELKDAKVTAGTYRAIYTDALAAALSGVKDPTLLQTGDDRARYVRPWPLKFYLATELTRILSKAAVPLGTSQIPDARITSPPTAWLARFDPEEAAIPPGVPPPPAARSPSRGPGPAPGLPPTRGLRGVRSRTQELFGRAFVDAGRAIPPAPGAPGGPRSADATNFGFPSPSLDGPEETLLAESIKRTAAPFDDAPFDTGCGLKVRGTRVVEVAAGAGTLKIVGDTGTQVSVEGASPGTSVLLRFENGSGALIPAIANFVAELTFEEDELINVAYQPALNSSRRAGVKHVLTLLRKIRSVAASSARLGVFRLEGANALELAQLMQFVKGSDPTMALYAAYAYNDLQRNDDVSRMQWYMQGDIQLVLFDVALLSRALDGKRTNAFSDVFPCFPMLSQGWGLLAAHQMTLPAVLTGLQRHLRPSLWTLFDSEGTAQIAAAVKSGEIL